MHTEVSYSYLRNTKFIASTMSQLVPGASKFCKVPSGHLSCAESDCSTSAITDIDRCLSEDFQVDAVRTLDDDTALRSALNAAWFRTSDRADVFRDIFESLAPSRIVEVQKQDDTFFLATIQRTTAEDGSDDAYRLWRSSSRSASLEGVVEECSTGDRVSDLVLLTDLDNLQVLFEMLWKCEGMLSQDSIVCVDLAPLQDSFAKAFKNMVEACPSKVCFEAGGMLVVQRANFPGTFAA
eukprot:TRINITY_DN13567_c0_g1_i1.p1 TRINITY_DN13567_c0_g1~~TRINITY_DN13567_c0_g1_i1.p1  ORF type:complete len:238 (+),score=51.60 TRINITY_DN13567_c0_g1_i1:153-866(+)